MRIWHRPRVKLHGRYRLGGGAIIVDRIDEVEFDALTPALARRCGFASLVDLLKTAKHGAGERVFVIEFHYVPTSDIDSRAEVGGAADIDEIIRKLDAMDRRRSKPWTRQILRLIAKHPGVRAADLASALHRERLEFKADLRKLKALGLTLSLEVGYRISELGKAVLKRRS